jgi:hypothetical protein
MLRWIEAFIIILLLLILSYFRPWKKVSSYDQLVIGSIHFLTVEIQWATLNGITDTTINQLTGSNLSQLISPEILFNT